MDRGRDRRSVYTCPVNSLVDGVLEPQTSDSEKLADCAYSHSGTMIEMISAANHIDLRRGAIVALHAMTPTELQDAVLRAVITMFQEVVVPVIVLEVAHLFDVGREAQPAVAEIM